MPVLLGTKNVSKSVVVVLLGMIVGKLLSFVWRGMLSGEMTATGFSDFVAFFICINIVSQVAFTPINELIAREPLFRYHSRRTLLYFSRLYGVACMISIIIVCGMMLGFATIYERIELQGLLLWAVMLLPLAGLLMFFVAMLRAAGDHVARSLFILVGIHLFFVILLMLRRSGELNGTISLFFVSYLLVTTLCSAYFLKWYPFRNDTSASIYVANLPQQMKFMIPMFLVQLLEATSGWVDSIVLGAFIYKAMGAYSNVSFLSKAVLMANSALYFVIIPVFSRILYDDDKVSLASEYKKRTNHLALIVTPLAIFLFAYSHEVLALFFSIKEPSMSSALQILVTGYWVATLFGPILAMTLAYGKTGEILICTLIYISLNTTLSLFLGPIYGVVGVAISASGSYLVSIIYLVVRCGGSVEIVSYKVIFYAACVVSLALVLIWFLHFIGLSSIMRIIIGGIVIALVSFAAYLVLLANTQEKLWLRNLCHDKG